MRAERADGRKPTGQSRLYDLHPGRARGDHAGRVRLFIAVTVAGLIAGIRLLPRGRPVWYGAVGAAVAMGVVLLFSGVFLAVPALLSVAALLYTTSRRLTDP